MTADMTVDSHGGSRPVPDPTLLTTEALMREVAALKELLNLRLGSEAEARRSDIASALASVEMHSRVCGEKFVGLDRELHLKEQRRIEQKADTKLAVDAALQAAKEAFREQSASSALAIAKSENATNEQLKQLNVTFTTALHGVDRTINDLKDRVSKVEQIQAAQAGRGQGVQQSWGVLIGSIAAVAGVFGIIMVIIELAIPR